MSVGIYFAELQEGYTALEMAVQDNQTEVARLLLLDSRIHLGGNNLVGYSNSDLIVRVLISVF